MALGLYSRLGFAAVLFAAALAAQQPTEPAGPKFDVVSIHLVPANTPPTLRSQDFTPVLPGGQFVDSRTILLFMISYAYDVKNPSTQLVGVPKWAREQSYSITAKPAPGFPVLPPAENYEQVRLMLRAMLAERFHLRLHTETRQEKVFHLVVAKGGFKFNEAVPPVPPDKSRPVGAAMGDDGGRMIGQKSTIASLVGVLTMFLKRQVEDRTGLKGYYDFDVKWSALESPDGQRPGPGFGTAGAGLLISTLKNQFGLELKNGTGPVKYWVVDNVEPPTEN